MKLLVQLSLLLTFVLSTSGFLHKPAFSAHKMVVSAPNNSLGMVPKPALKAVSGVRRCIVGYSGGLQPDPTYQNIMDYTEAVLVEYDPNIVSFEDILKKWRSFGQPYPAKTQYRWAIFTMNPQQEMVAKEFCAGEKHVAIEPVTQFYMAEEYHQDFLKKSGSLRY